MRTILKLKSKNKKEAIDALKKAIDHLEKCVDDDEKKIVLRVNKQTEINQILFL